MFPLIFLMATHNEWEVVQVDNEDKNLCHKFFALFENIASMHVLLSFGTMTSFTHSLCFKQTESASYVKTEAPIPTEIISCTTDT